MGHPSHSHLLYLIAVEFEPNVRKHDGISNTPGEATGLAGIDKLVAHQLYLEAAAANHILAQTVVGVTLHYGLHGITRDLEGARAMYLAAVVCVRVRSRHPTLGCDLYTILLPSISFIKINCASLFPLAGEGPPE